MNSRVFHQVIFWGVSAAAAFAALFMGAVELWAMTVVEWTVWALLFLWFWRMNNRSGWRFKAGWIDGPVWLLVVLALGSWFFSVYRYDSMLAVFRLAAYVGVYYLVLNHFDRRLRLRFFIFLIVLGTALSILGICQLSFGLTRWWWNSPQLLSATYVNHSHFAGLLEMVIPLAAGLLAGLTREDTVSRFQLIQWRALLSGALLIMLTAFVLSQSRGGWVVLLVSSIAVVVALAARRSLSKGGVMITLAGLIVFIGFLGFETDWVAGRLHSIELSKESKLFSGRADVWKGSVDIIRDHPASGTGPGTFVWAFPQYRPAGLTAFFDYAHNDYLQLAVELGVLAIPVVLWGIGVILLQGFRRAAGETRLSQAMRLGCVCGLSAMILHGLVDFNFYVPANMLIFAALTACLMRDTSARA